MPTSVLIRVWTSVVMGWPESLSYLLLVVLGYALTRVVDLACDWQTSRLSRAIDPATGTPISAAVECAVNQGHGTYGMLYQIRDDYGDLLRQAPTGITHAADSMIRCVTLLVNLGPSDQRFAMFTRALRHFDEECEKDQGLKEVPPGSRRQEFHAIGAATVESIVPEFPGESDSSPR